MKPGHMEARYGNERVNTEGCGVVVKELGRESALQILCLVLFNLFSLKYVYVRSLGAHIA